MISRRTFLKLSGVALAGAYGSTLAFGIDSDEIKVENVLVPSPHLPQSFHQYRIGFLTDLHLGGWVPNELIEKAVALVKHEGVDLLLLGGDYIWVPDSYSSVSIETIRNHSFTATDPDLLAHEIFRTTAQILKGVNTPDGRYAVLGNHDRWQSGDAYLQQFPKGDISLLQNGIGEVRRGNDLLRVVGTEDLWSGVPRVPNMPPPDKNEYRILLSHNPDFVGQAFDRLNFKFHLGLSGHTHGGQVNLPFVGPLHYNIEDLRFKAGLVEYKGAHAYTSRGIGVVEVPFRVNCPPEVTILTLTRV